jgi:hypothetical protein
MLLLCSQVQQRLERTFLGVGQREGEAVHAG